MPRTRRWMLAILVLLCVAIAPMMNAPGPGLADEVQDLRAESNTETFEDDQDDDDQDNDVDIALDTRLDGIRFPNDDKLRASFFSRNRDIAYLPDPEEYVSRDGVGGGSASTIDFPEYSSDGSRVFPLAHGTFRISQEFGCVPLDPGYALADFCPPDRPSFHNGIDFAADEGTIIYAAATGTVSFAEIDPSNSSGNSVIRIIHDGSNSGYVTEYFHWITSYIETGDYVIAGQPIAEVGSIGYSSGPHLHFGVFDAKGGEFIEPLQWLKSSESVAVETTAGGVGGGTDGVMQWAAFIEASSAKHGIPAALIAAIITVESGGNPEAVSPVGAQGLMQVMPMHLERYEIPTSKWRDPATNIDAGTRLLAELLSSNGTLTNAVAAYFGIGCDVLGTCTSEYVAAVYSWYTYYLPLFAGTAVNASDFEFEVPEEPIEVAAGDNSSSEPARQQPTPTATPDVTPTPDVAAIPQPTETPRPTEVPSPTETPAPAETPEPTPLPADDSDDQVESEPTPTPAPADDSDDPVEPEPSPTPKPSDDSDDVVEPEPTPTPKPSDDSDDSGEPEPTPEPEPEPSPTPEPPADEDAADDEDEEQPRNPGFAEGHGSFWVVDREASILLRLEPGTDELVAMVELDAEPYGVAVSENAVWVSIPLLNQVVRIDPETNEIVATIEVDAEPRSIAVSHEGVWVVKHAAQAIARIEIEPNQVVEVIDLDVPPCDVEIVEGQLLVRICESDESLTIER